MRSDVRSSFLADFVVGSALRCECTQHHRLRAGDAQELADGEFAVQPAPARAQVAAVLSQYAVVYKQPEALVQQGPPLAATRSPPR